jgi:hypothetical protein
MNTYTRPNPYRFTLLIVGAHSLLRRRWTRGNGESEEEGALEHGQTESGRAKLTKGLSVFESTNVLLDLSGPELPSCMAVTAVTAVTTWADDQSTR